MNDVMVCVSRTRKQYDRHRFNWDKGSGYITDKCVRCQAPNPHTPARNPDGIETVVTTGRRPEVITYALFRVRAPSAAWQAANP